MTGRSPRAFSDALGALRPRERGHCDVLFSLERVAHCDCYRAGDGVHMSMNGYIRITKGLAARIRATVEAAHAAAPAPVNAGEANPS